VPNVKVEEVNVALPAVRFTGACATPSTVNVTVPVGVPPTELTAAVIDTALVIGAGLMDEAIEVALAALFTTTPDCTPVIETMLASVAAIDCVPAVFNVALNVWTPLSPATNV
jgi:branched-subunit amino acid ABC-type transport system permease component